MIIIMKKKSKVTILLTVDVGFVSAGKPLMLNETTVR